MYKVLVLVRNIACPAEGLDFGEFTVRSIRYPEHFDLRETLACHDVFVNDWVLEKTYSELPVGPANAPAGVGGIPNDIEDILFLLRLYKVGDVGFARQAIIKPDGNRVVQNPYRFINDLNCNSVLPTEFTQDECTPWLEFANGLRRSQSWKANWFSVTRRFFLYGGAKELSPMWNEVDRVVDYATALEATLVPEADFSRRRISERAAIFLSSDPAEQEAVAKLVKKLYDIRSSIVHGSVLTETDRDWLIENCGQVELRVRQVLVAAVQQVSNDEQQRRSFLSSLFDVTDENRGEVALQRFRTIETDQVRRTVAAEISRLIT